MSEKGASIMAKKLKGEPTCPECGKSIERLDWIACVNGEGGKKTELVGVDYDFIYYFCPKCEELLFDDEEEAIDFIE